MTRPAGQLDCNGLINYHKELLRIEASSGWFLENRLLTGSSEFKT